MAELLISANNGHTQQIGEVVDVKPDGQVWGRREQPPDYVHLTVTGATREEVAQYADGWRVEFQHEIMVDNPAGYRIKVEADPIYISASNVGKDVLKDEMQTWFENKYGASVVSFFQNSMTVDIPKPVNLVDVKREFSGRFTTVLDIRRYRFSAADVNTALANGGSITLTKAQALSRVIDKLDL